jgi:serine/threonine-protein kinase
VITAERSEFVGEVLDRRYRILRRIGLGGTGVVFVATPIRGDGFVAVKMLRRAYASHRDIIRRMRREAEVARAVRHPGIVPVIDEGTLYDGSPYLVMPKMNGESLLRLIRQNGRLEPSETAAMAVRVCEILHAAHAAGYTHRDVKPEHILLDRDETGALQVYLLDFGVCASRAGAEEDHSAEMGKVFGTPSYVSPEQAAGRPDVDGRADLFSLGVVMFEALTGRVPFMELPVSKLLLRIIKNDAPRVSSSFPGIDPALDELVARLLSRNPLQRPRSAERVARMLAPFAGNQGSAEARLMERFERGGLRQNAAPTVRRRVPAPVMAAA